LKIWKNIRVAREAAHMSQADLAKKSGIELQSIMKYESEELEPTVEIIMTIAAALKIEPRELLNEK
jgi:transcriptional regulator with XRE-family HTH domain